MSEFASTSFHFPLIWPVWPLRAVPPTSVFSLLTPFGQVIKEKSAIALRCTKRVCIWVRLEVTDLFQGGKTLRCKKETMKQE